MAQVITILANGRAGGGSTRRYAGIVKYAETHGIPMIVTHELDEVVPALIELVVRQKPAVLGIYGGDGALQKTMDVLFGFLRLGLILDLPALLLLGGGTVRSTLYVCGWFWTKPEDVLRSVHKRLILEQELPVLKRCPLVVRFGECEHYGFEVLGGILAKLGHYMNSGKKSRWVFFGKALRAIFGAVTGWGPEARLLGPDRLRMICDGESHPEAPLLGYFLESFPNPLPLMRPFDTRGYGQQSILAIISALRPWQVALRLPGLWRRWLRRPKNTINRPMREITLISGDPEFSLLLEGDNFQPGTLPVSITVAPHPVRLVVKRVKKANP